MNVRMIKLSSILLVVGALIGFGIALRPMHGVDLPLPLSKAPLPTLLSRGRIPAEIVAESPYFYVYADKKSPLNHFHPYGWMGDYNDLRFFDVSTEQPHSGTTCLKITYLATGGRGLNWAGMYWQEPLNNWGYAPGGYDLTGMKRLTFWARGLEGGEKIGVFAVGGIDGTYPDSAYAAIRAVTLAKTWTLYTISLEHMNLQKISGGFAWAANRFDNAGPLTFYLDDIRFER